MSAAGAQAAAAAPHGGRKLQVAVLGAGGWLKDQMAPALASLTEQALVTAVWSRSDASAAAAAAEIQGQFSPSCRPCHGDDGLQALLAEPDLDAVLVVLPPQAQGAVIQAALRAGKHVLSEKPAAPTLAQAEQLLAFHRSLPQAPLWCVAENYRSMPAFLRLRDALRADTMGPLARLDMAVDLSLSPGNKYYESSWRRDSATMPGAYLTEGGVHFVAALRLAAAAAGWGEATAVAAASSGVAEDLPQPDSLAGLVWFESGNAATYAITTAAGAMRVALRAVGTRGSAEAARGAGAGGGRAFRLTVQAAGQAEPTQVEAAGSGVEDELHCFFRLCRAAGGKAAAGAGVSQTLTAREAGAAATTDGSDPERDAVAAEPAPPQAAAAGAGARGGGGGGGARGGAAPAVVERDGQAPLQEFPSDEDAWRVSCVEAARDLAVCTALLESAAGGGCRVEVAQF